VVRPSPRLLRCVTQNRLAALSNYPAPLQAQNSFVAGGSLLGLAVPSSAPRAGHRRHVSVGGGSSIFSLHEVDAPPLAAAANDSIAVVSATAGPPRPVSPPMLLAATALGRTLGGGGGGVEATDADTTGSEVAASAEPTVGADVASDWAATDLADGWLPKPTNPFEFYLALQVTNAILLLPPSLYSADDSVALRTPRLDLELRNLHLFTDLHLNVEPLVLGDEARLRTLHATDPRLRLGPASGRGTLAPAPVADRRWGIGADPERTTVRHVNVHLHLMNGPRPLELAYRVMGEADVGDVVGQLSVSHVMRLADWAASVAHQVANLDNVLDADGEDRDPGAADVYVREDDSDSGSGTWASIDGSEDEEDGEDEDEEAKTAASEYDDGSSGEAAAAAAARLGRVPPPPINTSVGLRLTDDVGVARLAPPALTIQPRSRSRPASAAMSAADATALKAAVSNLAAAAPPGATTERSATAMDLGLPSAGANASASSSADLPATASHRFKRWQSAAAVWVSDGSAVPPSQGTGSSAARTPPRRATGDGFDGGPAQRGAVNYSGAGHPRRGAPVALAARGSAALVGGAAEPALPPVHRGPMAHATWTVRVGRIDVTVVTRTVAAAGAPAPAAMLQVGLAHGLRLDFDNLVNAAYVERVRLSAHGITVRALAPAPMLSQEQWVEAGSLTLSARFSLAQRAPNWLTLQRQQREFLEEQDHETRRCPNAYEEAGMSPMERTHKRAAPLGDLRDDWALAPVVAAMPKPPSSPASAPSANPVPPATTPSPAPLTDAGRRNDGVVDAESTDNDSNDDDDNDTGSETSDYVTASSSASSLLFSATESEAGSHPDVATEGTAAGEDGTDGTDDGFPSASQGDALLDALPTAPSENAPAPLPAGTLIAATAAARSAALLREGFRCYRRAPGMPGRLVPASPPADGGGLGVSPGPVGEAAVVAPPPPAGRAKAAVPTTCITVGLPERVRVLATPLVLDVVTAFVAEAHRPVRQLCLAIVLTRPRKTANRSPLP